MLVVAPVFYFLHWPFLGLPYFWDEAAQFVPVAQDVYNGAGWIPHSAVPNIHPPGLMAYVALAWRVAGTGQATTRSAILLLSVCGAFCAFLLARELCLDLPGKPALLTLVLLLASPLFFAQSMLAQLDAPAMLFTSLALVLFLRGRFWWAAAASTRLVLVKETGLVVALVLFLMLAWSRRWRQAACFMVPAAILGTWVSLLALRTGHWAGSAEFERFNVLYPLHPVRLIFAALRRIYYLLVAGFHWIGAAGILYAWRKSRIFHTHQWRTAWLTVLGQVALVTVTGGAVLDRYLLPIIPILYAAMAAGMSLWPRRLRLTATGALLVGLAAANWINPFYPFPYENNLAFSDFLELHQKAAAYLEHEFPKVRVDTAWPLSLELSRPELGFVVRRVPIEPLPNFTPETVPLRSLGCSLVG
jgi:4-amino-4-deoxy-L-arabinose transferase-like glycosyltransferase